MKWNEIDDGTFTLDKDRKQCIILIWHQTTMWSRRRPSAGQTLYLVKLINSVQLIILSWVHQQVIEVNVPSMNDWSFEAEDRQRGRADRVDSRPTSRCLPGPGPPTWLATVRRTASRGRRDWRHDRHARSRTEPRDLHATSRGAHRTETNEITRKYALCWPGPLAATYLPKLDK